MREWPASLPPPLIDGYRESFAATVVRSDMDQGPAKVRQRTTTGVSDLNVSFLLDRTRCSTLETFFHVTCRGGSLSFTFVHPRRQSTVTARFKKPPALSSTNGESFRVTLELEILP